MQEQAIGRDTDLPLEFGGTLVVVGGGVFDADLLRELKSRGAAVIGADGGADACARAGVMPDAVIGDMDSLQDPQAWAKRSRFIRIEEQQTTDFEKCLHATRAGVTVALGMTGRRFDHTLAALNAVAGHAAGRHIILVDECDIALGVSGSLSFDIAQGARVSVHPLGRVSFAASNGLEYPLDGLTLALGERGGTSNRAIAGRVSITTARGEQSPWLLVIDAKYLWDLIAALA